MACCCFAAAALQRLSSKYLIKLLVRAQKCWLSRCGLKRQSVLLRFSYIYKMYENFKVRTFCFKENKLIGIQCQGQQQQAMSANGYYFRAARSRSGHDYEIDLNNVRMKTSRKRWVYLIS